MRRIRTTFFRTAFMLGATLGLAGCASSYGGYSGYTEYRVPPVKSQTEIAQERREARARSDSQRGRIVDTGGSGILYGN